MNHTTCGLVCVLWVYCSGIYLSDVLQSYATWIYKTYLYKHTHTSNIGQVSVTTKGISDDDAVPDALSLHLTLFTPPHTHTHATYTSFVAILFTLYTKAFVY